jgi:hypothetical protein
MPLLQMSEPIRYTQAIKCVEPSYHAQDICSGIVECSIGEWVLHSDYARLKAEVDAIRKELAEAQENYHLVNEIVAKMLKAGKSIE